jgi:hypothetical protein
VVRELGVLHCRLEVVRIPVWPPKLQSAKVLLLLVGQRDRLPAMVLHPGPNRPLAAMA